MDWFDLSSVKVIIGQNIKWYGHLGYSLDVKTKLNSIVSSDNPVNVNVFVGVFSTDMKIYVCEESIHVKVYRSFITQNWNQTR